jgi:predicted DsbA family dithiol-disulfide isomerase
VLRSFGISVIVLPFELHPEIPVGGYERSRSVERWAVIAEECAAAGLPFDPQPRSPNTRRVLELSEWVRRTSGPEVHERFERSVFEAHFARRLPVDDAGVQRELLAALELAADEAFAALDGGEPSDWVDESMALAHEAGVGGTPAWLIGGVSALDEGGGFMIPGVHPRPFYERLATRLTART